MAHSFAADAASLTMQQNMNIRALRILNAYCRQLMPVNDTSLLKAGGGTKTAEVSGPLTGTLLVYLVVIAHAVGHSFI